MRVDRHAHLVGGLFLVIALTCGYLAMGYRLGSLQRMGPGYFPLLVAIALGVVGLGLIAQALMQPRVPMNLRDWNLRPVLAVCGATVVFGLTLKPWGMAAAMILLIGIANLGNPRRSLKMTLMSLAFLIPASWLIFIWMLQLPMTVLPKGWGI